MAHLVRWRSDHLDVLCSRTDAGLPPSRRDRPAINGGHRRSRRSRRRRASAAPEDAENARRVDIARHLGLPRPSPCARESAGSLDRISHRHGHHPLPYHCHGAPFGVPEGHVVAQWRCRLCPDSQAPRSPPPRTGVTPALGCRAHVHCELAGVLGAPRCRDPGRRLRAGPLRERCVDAGTTAARCTK